MVKCKTKKSQQNHQKKTEDSIIQNKAVEQELWVAQNIATQKNKRSQRIQKIQKRKRIPQQRNAIQRNRFKTEEQKKAHKKNLKTVKTNFPKFIIKNFKKYLPDFKSTLASEESFIWISHQLSKIISNTRKNQKNITQTTLNKILYSQPHGTQIRKILIKIINSKRDEMVLYPKTRCRKPISNPKQYKYQKILYQEQYIEIMAQLLKKLGAQ